MLALSLREKKKKKSVFPEPNPFFYKTGIILHIELVLIAQ